MKELVKERYQNCELVSCVENLESYNIQIKSIKLESYCPDCGVKSDYIKFSFQRTFKDVGYNGKQVIVEFDAKSFVCKSKDCSRKTFMETHDFILPGVKYSNDVIKEIMKMKKQSCRTISAKMKEIHFVKIGKSTINEQVSVYNSKYEINDVDIIELNKEKLEEAISERIDFVISTPENPTDVILEYVDNVFGLCESINESFPTKTVRSHAYPVSLYWLGGLSARLKGLTATRNIPLALTSKQLVNSIGYNFLKTRADNTYFSSGIFRDYLKAISNEEIIDGYNNNLKKINNKLEIKPSIHIVDTTKIAVPLDAMDYENSTVVNNEDNIPTRGYKMVTLYGVGKNNLILEKSSIDEIKRNDADIIKDFLNDTSYFKKNDVLLLDRGFGNTEFYRLLQEKEIYVITPSKKNSNLFKDALSGIGIPILDTVKNKETNQIFSVKLTEQEFLERDKVLSEKRKTIKWEKHPTDKNSEITLLKELEVETSNKKILKVNAVVLRVENKYISDKTKYYHDDGKYNYIVFYSTNLKHKANQIIKLYTKRTGIEEQYKQLKVFWDLEQLRSRKYKYIVFQLMTTVNALAMLQLYCECDEGKKYANKSIMTIKNTGRFRESKKTTITIISGKIFCVYYLSEAMKLIISKPNSTQDEFIKKLEIYEKS